MPPRRTSRIYTRTRGGATRYYGDFRDYADVGGTQEPLCAPGEHFATSDPDIAAKLAADRLSVLEARRRGRTLLGEERDTTLHTFAAHHLVEKRDEGASASWLTSSEVYLGRAVEFFGGVRPRQLGREEADPDLRTLGVDDVRAFIAWLRTVPSGRKGNGRLGEGSVRHHLNVLSNLYTRAASEGYVAPGYNPVAALMSKPKARRHHARWLEVHEAALYLEAARLAPELIELTADTFGLRLRRAVAAWDPEVPEEVALIRFGRALRSQGMRATDAQLAAYLEAEKHPSRGFVAAAAELLGVQEEWLRRGGAKKRRPEVAPYVYPLIATYLLTGMRETEALGLDLADIQLERKIIHVRANEWRGVGTGIKNEGSERVVPIWPQLEEILREWIFAETGPRPMRGLVFPSPITGEMLTDIRKPLDTVAELAGWEAGEIRTKLFRHTYASARLQTLDNGAPVQVWSVARELGHGSLDMINGIYGHLGQIRHRSEVVEYRVEQHADVEGYQEKLGRLHAQGTARL